MMARLVAAVMAIAMCGLANAATINVPGDYTQIQAAVDAASNGDEILVAPGTYTGNGDQVVDILGKEITLRASGTVEETIIDGDGERMGILCDNGETAAAIIEGFTIMGGYAGNGGGIYCGNSNPTITNCVVKNNTASNRGGGISCNGSNPTITDCTIWLNTAASGGGIDCLLGSPTISGCTITGNTTNNKGGGIWCYGSNPTISDCTISDNTASFEGGGIYCTNNSNPTISECTITGNTATDGGGVALFYKAGLLLTDTTVCSNSPNQITGTYSDEGGNTLAAICPVPGACCTNGACVIAEQDDCLAFYGQWLGEGTTCNDSPCPIACLGDVTGDSQVSVNDVLTVIGNWGPCP